MAEFLQNEEIEVSCNSNFEPCFNRIFFSIVKEANAKFACVSKDQGNRALYGLRLTLWKFARQKKEREMSKDIEHIGSCKKCGGSIIYDYATEKFFFNSVGGCLCRSEYPDSFLEWRISVAVSGTIGDLYETWKAGREAFMAEIEEFYNTK